MRERKMFDFGLLFIQAATTNDEEEGSGGENDEEDDLEVRFNSRKMIQKKICSCFFQEKDDEQE